MGALVQLLPRHHRLRPAKGGSAPSSPCPWLPDRRLFRRIYQPLLALRPAEWLASRPGPPPSRWQRLLRPSLLPRRSPHGEVGYHYAAVWTLAAAGLAPAGTVLLWAATSLHRVSPTSPLLRVAPSLCLASVRSSSWVRHLEFSLVIEATGSHVPPKGLAQSHATSMPGVIQASCSLSLDRSRANDSARFRHHPYAFDTFPVVHPCSSL